MTKAQRILGAMIALLVVAAGVGWFVFQQRPPELVLIESTPSTRPGSLGHGRTGPVGAALVPTSAEPNAERDDPVTLWKQAFATMAKDPHTEAMLSDLCGGLRVKFALLPDHESDKTFDKSPLEPGYDLAFRVRIDSTELGKSLTEDGSELPYLAVGFSYSSTVPSRFANDGGLQESAALRLVLEDHFLRRSKGWRLIWEKYFDNLFVAALVKKGPGIAGLRADLDRRLKERAAHAKTWRETQDAKKGP